MALVPTTWNPADKGAGVTLSGGNLTAASNAYSAVRSTYGASAGKHYWETSASTNGLVGVGTAAAALNVLPAYPGGQSASWGIFSLDGSKYNNDVSTAYAESAGSSITGVLLDMDAGTLGFTIGGVYKGVAFSGLSGTLYAMFGGGSIGAASESTANFGATAFAYTPPAGFNAGFGVLVADYALSGTVRDATGALAARKIAAYREDTNALVGTTTSDATTGVYSIGTEVGTAHTLVFYPAVGENLNALVLRGVLPIES